jgi:hypothetical protein
MGDQLQQYQTAQKWYAKPQVLVPAAALGYLLLNKKTRKKTLTGGGWILLAIGGYSGITERKNETLSGLYKLPLIAGGALLALGYFSKSK